MDVDKPRDLIAAFVRDRPRTLARARRLQQRAKPLALLETRAQGRERLVERPVFVLSSVRSGSTLLRMMLNAHSGIRAPHELHLNAVRVEATGMSKSSMGELGFDNERLQFLLWDRVLHRELLDSGKQILVDKTPSNTMVWRKLLRCWPDARFIILRRHPGAVFDSWRRAHPDWSQEDVAAYVARYLPGMAEAYAERGGLILRYEDLVADPSHELTRVCEFLEVAYEPAMLEYGSTPTERYRRGLGDWSAKIRSGRIHAVDRLPDPADVPDTLVPVSHEWGYL